MNETLTNTARSFSEVSYSTWAVFTTAGLLSWGYLLLGDWLYAQGHIDSAGHLLGAGLVAVLSALLLVGAGMVLREGYETAAASN